MLAPMRPSPIIPNSIVVSLPSSTRPRCLRPRRSGWVSAQLEAANCRTVNGCLPHHHVDRHPLQQIAQAPLAGKGLGELLPPERREETQRYSPREVDASGGEHLEGEVARLGAQDSG